MSSVAVKSKFVTNEKEEEKNGENNVENNDNNEENNYEQNGVQAYQKMESLPVRLEVRDNSSTNLFSSNFI